MQKIEIHFNGSKLIKQQKQMKAMKTRKDFPTTLKYKFYVFAQNFPQHFQQPKHQFPKQVLDESYIQFNDVEESRLPEFSNLGISMVKNLQSGFGIQQQDPSLLQETKTIVNNMTKAKLAEQKPKIQQCVQKRLSNQEIQQKQFNKREDQATKLKEQQKKELQEKTKNAIKVQQYKDESSDEEKRNKKTRELKQKAKISTRRSQASLEMSVSETNSVANIQKKSTDLNKNQTKPKISDQQLSIHEISQISISLNESMHQNIDLLQKQNRQKAEDCLQKKYPQCENLPSFQIKRQKVSIQNKLSEAQQMDQNISVKQLQAKEAKTPEKHMASDLHQINQKEISKNSSFEKTTEKQAFIKSQMLQSEVRHKQNFEQGEKSLFQSNDKQQIKQFFPSIEDEEQNPNSSKEKLKEKRPIAVDKAIIRQQRQKNNEKQEESSQDFEINDLSNQNQQNLIEKQNKKNEIRQQKSHIFESSKNKLVRRFLDGYQKQSGKSWFKQSKNKEQQNEEKIQKCNKDIEQLKNQVQQSNHSIKNMMNYLTELQKRIQRTQQKNRNLQQVNIKNQNKIAILENAITNLLDQSELDKKQLTQLKLKHENSQKTSHSDREIMRQKIEVLQVQLGRQTIKLGDFMVLNQAPSKLDVQKRKSN